MLWATLYGRFLESNFAVPANLIKERIGNLKRHTPNRSARKKNEDPDANKGGNPSTQSPSGRPGNNSLDVTIPIHISVRLGEFVSANKTNFLATASASNFNDDEGEEFITEGNPADYDDREGYDPDFLGQQVPLPKIKSTTKKKDILEFDNSKQN